LVVAEIIKTPKTRSRIEDLGNWIFVDALDWLQREQSGYRYSTITYAQWMDLLVQLCAGQIARQGSRQRGLFVKEFASTPRLRNLSQIIRPSLGGGWMTKETKMEGEGYQTSSVGEAMGPVTLFHLLWS
jgi:hypothetical protein